LSAQVPAQFSVGDRGGLDGGEDIVEPGSRDGRQLYYEGVVLAATSIKRVERYESRLGTSGVLLLGVDERTPGPCDLREGP
jgi:hypothetical protein